MKTKTCRDCGRTKPVTQFLGNTYRCTTCVSARVTGVDVRGAIKRAPDRSAPSYEVYRPKHHDPAVAAPGCMDFLQYPSRMGNRLHYRDGRVTDMRGNPA